MLKPITFVFFYMFLFFLPLYEAPKNIFGGLFVILGAVWWVLNKRSLLCELHGQQKEILSLLLLLVITPFFSGLGEHTLDSTDSFANALNWSLMPLIALVFLLIKPSERQSLVAVRLLCVSGVVAVIQSFFSWDGVYPELNSVGHVNQSALYVTFLLVGVGFIFFSDRFSRLDWLLGIVVSICVFAYQGPARSLVAFAGAVVACGILVVGYFVVKQKWMAATSAFVIGLTIILVGMTTPYKHLGLYADFKKELDSRFDSVADPFSQRDRLLSSAWLVASDSAFGYGIKSFSNAVTWERLEAKALAQELNWDQIQSDLFVSKHGHNLFANVLVERGWVGVLSIALFLFSIILIQTRYFARGDGLSLPILATLILVLLCGLGQSTLHNEHGQLALLWIVLGYALQRVHQQDVLGTTQ